MPIKKEINRPLMKLCEICFYVMIIKNLKMLKNILGGRVFRRWRKKGFEGEIHKVCLNEIIGMFMKLGENLFFVMRMHFKSPTKNYYN